MLVCQTVTLAIVSGAVKYITLSVLQSFTLIYPQENVLYLKAIQQANMYMNQSRISITSERYIQSTNEGHAI